ALASEASSVDEGITPDRDHGVGTVRPWGHRHANPYVVAENHHAWPSDDQSPVDAQITAGMESNSAERIVSPTPHALENCSRLPHGDRKLAQGATDQGEGGPGFPP